MVNRLANIELILSKCLEGAMEVESAGSITPELLGAGADLIEKSGGLLEVAASETANLERELEEKGVASAYLESLKGTLLDLQSAAKCLALHLQIMKNFHEWSDDKERCYSVEEGLAVFAKSLEAIKKTDPPASIEKLCRNHERLTSYLEAYSAICSKIKQAMEEGTKEVMEEASAEFEKLESEQRIDNLEMFSLKEELERAMHLLEGLKREIRGLHGQ